MPLSYNNYCYFYTSTSSSTITDPGSFEIRRPQVLCLVMQQSATEKERGRSACKRKEDSGVELQPPPQPQQSPPPPQQTQHKKPRLVFTDLQRRTLQAIFKETERPSKEMQVTIARQLGLDPSTVSNFFMNARRRSIDKWREDPAPDHDHHHHQHVKEDTNEDPEGDDDDEEEDEDEEQYEDMEDDMEDEIEDELEQEEFDEENHDSPASSAANAVSAADRPMSVGQVQSLTLARLTDGSSRRLRASPRASAAAAVLVASANPTSNVVHEIIHPQGLVSPVEALVAQHQSLDL